MGSFRGKNPCQPGSDNSDRVRWVQGDEASEEWRFHPEFTHQAFPNEVIEGYEDVQIE